MLDNLLKVIFGLEEYELLLMKRLDILEFEDFTVLSKIDKSFKLALYSTSLSWNKGSFDKHLFLFRSDIIEKTSRQLIGMELKRGCQYDREWIHGIEVDYVTKQIVIQSSTGQHYNANNVRVYDTESTLTPLFNFASKLVFTNVEIKECKKCCT